jgi:hypothetical protein
MAILGEWGGGSGEWKIEIELLFFDLPPPTPHNPPSRRLRGRNDLTKMVAEPWATNAAGRAG